MVDIANKDALEDYLRSRNIMADCFNLYIRFFGGGVSGTVAYVSDGKKCLIVKQALPKLKVKDEWQCDPKRIWVEYQAQEVYASLVPEAVPRPVLYDDENCIMVREAAKESCPMWKTELLTGIFNFQAAQCAIRTLLTVHNLAAEKDRLGAKFNNNQYFYDLRINPYLERIAEIYPEYRADINEICQKLLKKKITLVHGDFSPKNILLTENGICLLDFEVAHKGHPAFDLAFFGNHFLLKAVKNKTWSAVYLHMLQTMLDTYFSEVTCMDKDELERDTLELLPFLMLARVDGKSPAEYLTSEEDKQSVREMAFAMINEKPQNRKEMYYLLKKNEKVCL